MGLACLARTIRTASHLRWSQVAARAARTIRRRLPSPRNGRRTFVDVAVSALADSEAFPSVPIFRHTCLKGRDLVESLERGEFHHLNQTVRIGREEPNWQLGPVEADRLWTVTLHYHQWLCELARMVADGDPPSGDKCKLTDRAEALLVHFLNDWLRRCDLTVSGSEHLAWNPYAIATRLGSWIRAMLLLNDEFGRHHPEFVSRWLGSMWRQARYLHAHLEWDIRANHLLRDAVGLAWAGRFFAGHEPDRWMRTAMKLAVAQADEQVLAEGGHFERSSFYHLEVMDDWLTLALLLEDETAREKMRSTWGRMAEYIVWLRHPDGRVAQLNDGATVLADDHLRHGQAIGVLRAPQVGKGRHLPERSEGNFAQMGSFPFSSPRGGRHLKDSGVVAWHGQPWSVFFDVGDLGPDYQPGHAHADTLTMECSFDGKRFFVDPGCYSYDNDERRRYDRATDSHNTVCINETDSSEVWHIFRVGRRAHPRQVCADFVGSGFRASGTHTGYDHLPGSPRHWREVTVTEQGTLQIVDRVEGRGEYRVSGGFLLEPSWEVSPTAGGWIARCRASQVKVDVAASADIRLFVERRMTHPDYGLEFETTRLCWRYEGGLPCEIRTSLEGIKT